MTKVLTQIQQNGILDGFDGCLRRSWSCFIFHSWLDYSFPRCILDLLRWPSRFGLFLDSGQISSLAVTKKKTIFSSLHAAFIFMCACTASSDRSLPRKKKNCLQMSEPLLESEPESFSWERAQKRETIFFPTPTPIREGYLFSHRKIWTFFPPPCG